MSEAAPARTRLQTSVKEALDRATRFGKLMVTFSQGGAIGGLRPAMGFINIIDPDFHLHLKDGSVSVWQAAEASDAGVSTYAALDADGKPTGLTISGPASAFTASSAVAAS